MDCKLVNKVFEASSLIDNKRTSQDVLTHLMTEVGELALEVQIDSGKSYKEPGIDGVIGESIDVIICALDLIYINNPNIDLDDIMKIVTAKCDKWVNLSS